MTTNEIQIALADDGNTALHPVENWDLVKSIADNMEKNGWVGRPLLGFRDEDGEVQFVTGSHRWEAARITGTEIEWVEIEGLTDTDKEALIEGFQDDREKIIERVGSEAVQEIFRREMEEGR